MSMNRLVLHKTIELNTKVLRNNFMFTIARMKKLFQ